MKTLSNFSSIQQKDKSNPNLSWAVPFVTNHKNRIHWDVRQLDFTNMYIELSPNSKPTESNILINIPFIGNYEAIDFYGKTSANYKADGNSPLYYPNETLNTVQSS